MAIKLNMIKKTALTNAMRKTLSVDERRDLCTGTGARLVEEWRFGEAQLQVLKSRSAQEAPTRYPLFWPALQPETIITQVMGSKPDVCSQMSQDIDWPLLKKVGTQGTSFSSDYLLPFVLEYYPDEARYSRQITVTKGMQLAKDQVKADLIRRCGKLTPLTWEQAVDVVCSKDTAAWPMGGLKSDPAVRQWLYDHPYDLTDITTLAGQRHQRNKQTDNGQPYPRIIFNADIRMVVLAAMYETPLVRALKADAEKHYDSPFMELNGVKAVGTQLATWDNTGRKTSSWYSFETDVKSMDKAFTIEHARHAYDMIEDLYDDTTYLWQSIQLSFTCPVVLSEDVVLTGDHAFLSGVTWTHMLEGVISYWAQTYIRNAIRVVMPEAKSLEARPLWHWKSVLINVAGDDTSLVAAVPEKCRFVTASAVNKPSSFDELVPELYARFLLPTAKEKVHTSRRYVNFCSKTYSKKACVKDVKGDVIRWLAVYSPVAAINGVLFPENDCEDPSLMRELLRVASIVDQCVGSEKCDALFMSLCNSIRREDRGIIAEALASPQVLAEAQLLLLSKQASWDHSTGNWSVETSAFLSYLSTWLGLTSEEQHALTNVLGDVNQLRRLMWLYHINVDASRGVYGSNSDMVFRAFFEDDDTKPAVPAKRGRPSYHKAAPPLALLADARRGLLDDDVLDPTQATSRLATDWRADIAWLDQMHIDSPIQEFGDPEKLQSTAADKAKGSVIDGVLVRDGEDWSE